MSSMVNTPEENYLVNLKIADHVKIELSSVRRYFTEQYHVAQKAFPDDLLLVRFTSATARESLILKAIASAARESDGFLLKVNVVEPVPSHSYLLKATSKVELNSISKSLQSIRRATRGASEKPFFPNEFALTLFSGLPHEKYGEMFPELTSLELGYQCFVDEVRLLKKDTSTSKWRMIETFRLKKEEQLKQATLF